MHGLDTYDYGARQYNPILARWDRIDPLAEEYYDVSPYVYCVNNPVNAIDPDGRKGYSLHRTSNGTTRNQSPKKFHQAMVLFGKTSFGHQLLADFTPKGETFFGVKGNGRYADFDLVINEYDYNIEEQTAKLYVGGGEFVNGQTQLNPTDDGKPRFDVIIDAQLGYDELLETICHEFCIHLSGYSEALEQYKKTGNYNDAKKVWNKESGSQQHKDILKGKQGKLKGTKKYFDTVRELINSNPKMKKVFDDKNKDYENRYK
jgi:hypothetical protein